METKIRIFAIFASVLMLTVVAVPMVGARRTQPITIQPITDFEDAIRIAERFLQINPDGTLTLNMPIRMIRSIGRDHYAQLQAGITQTNKMVSQGYLKIDENFNIHVTEKYLNRVKANTIFYQESLDISASDISISKNGNSITIIGILCNINAIYLYWWGFRLYLCDTIVDEIVRYGTRATVWCAVITALLVFIPIYGLTTGEKVVGVMTAIIALGTFELDYMNRFNTGLRFCFTWLPPSPFPFGLHRVTRQE